MIKIKTSGADKVVGIKVRAQIVKNRMGPPLRSADFDIFFDSGIDNYGSWLQVMKDSDLVKQSGAWYTYTDIESGEEIKFQSKDWVGIMKERGDIRDQVYKRICESTILQYKKGNINLDELELDTVVPAEND